MVVRTFSGEERGPCLTIPADGATSNETFCSQFGDTRCPRLTSASENHHRAGHTGRLGAATLADMARSCMGFHLRDRSSSYSTRNQFQRCVDRLRHIKVVRAV